MSDAAEILARLGRRRGRLCGACAVTDWNFADVWDAVARSTPERLAIIQGPARLTWGDFERRARGVAEGLRSTSAGYQSKVALYLHNGPEYLEVMYAAFKSGLVPVNTNYRFGQMSWSTCGPTPTARSSSSTRSSPTSPTACAPGFQTSTPGCASGWRPIVGDCL
ncbi:AMP-binding protein [Aeromicrobium sp. UC242_57]|uniref:AMP-binding protein n=1 Tax=Aeromicrobium sp. UC242_57 TaxID=3374624 RepID=UPI0037B9174B